MLYLEMSPYRTHFTLQGLVHLTVAVTFMTYRELIYQEKKKTF